MNTVRNLSVVLVCLLCSVSASAQDAHTPEEDFDINDYRWLTGQWYGPGMGGMNEEVWSEPEDGTMMGMYRHIKEGKTVFYEFLLLSSEGIKLKHFNPDLSSWEEKAETTDFEMVSFTENKLEMKALTFERISENEMEIRLRMRSKGEVRTVVFEMRRR